MLPKKLLTKLLATAYLSLAVSPAFADDITFSGSGPLQVGVAGTSASRAITNGDHATFTDGDSIILIPNGQADIYTDNAVIANILSQEVKDQNIDFTSASIALPTASGILDIRAPITVNGRMANLAQVTIYDGAMLTIKPNNTIEGLVSAVNTSPWKFENNAQLVIDSTDAKGAIRLSSDSPLLDENGAARITFNAIQDINYIGSITGSAGKFNSVVTSGTGNITISNDTNQKVVAIDNAVFGAASTKIDNDNIILNNVTLNPGSALNLSNGGSNQASITHLKIANNGANTASFVGPTGNIVITTLDMSDPVSLGVAGNVTVSSLVSPMNAGAHILVSKNSTLNLPSDVANLALVGGTAHFTSNATIADLIVDNSDPSGIPSHLTGDGTISITNADVEDATLETTANSISTLTLADATVNLTGNLSIGDLTVNLGTTNHGISSVTNTIALAVTGTTTVNSGATLIAGGTFNNVILDDGTANMSGIIADLTLNSSSIISGNSLTIGTLTSGSSQLTIAGGYGNGVVTITNPLSADAQILVSGGGTANLPGDINQLSLAGATAHFAANATIADLMVDADTKTGSNSSTITGDGTIAITEADVENSALSMKADTIGDLIIADSVVGITGNTSITTLTVNPGIANNGASSVVSTGTLAVTGTTTVTSGAALTTSGTFNNVVLDGGMANISGTIAALTLNSSSIISGNGLTIDTLTSGSNQLTIAGGYGNGAVTVNNQLSADAQILVSGGGTANLPGDINQLNLAGATAHFAANATIADLMVDADTKTGSNSSTITGDGTIAITEADVENSALSMKADTIGDLIIADSVVGITGNTSIATLTVNSGTANNGASSVVSIGTLVVTGTTKVNSGTALTTSGTFNNVVLGGGAAIFTDGSDTVTTLTLTAPSTLTGSGLGITDLSTSANQLTTHGTITVSSSVDQTANLLISGGIVNLPGSVDSITLANSTANFTAISTLNRLTINSGTGNTLQAPIVTGNTGPGLTVNDLTLPASTQLNIQGDVQVTDVSHVNADATIAVSGGGTLSLPASTLNLILSGSKADFSGYSTIKHLSVNADANSGAISYLRGAGPITINEFSIDTGAFLDSSQVSGGINITAASLGTGQNMSFPAGVPTLTLTGATAVFPSGSAIQKLIANAGTGSSNTSTITILPSLVGATTATTLSATDVKITSGAILTFPGDIISTLTLTGGKIDFNNTSSGKIQNLTVRADAKKSAITATGAGATSIASASVDAGAVLDVAGNITNMLTLTGGTTNFTRTSNSIINYLKADNASSTFTGAGPTTITDVTVDQGATLSISRTGTGTISIVDVAVDAGATLNIAGNITNSLTLTDGIANFIGNSNTVKDITVGGNSILTGTYNKSDGTWLVKQGATLQVPGLTSAKFFIFEQGDTTGNLVVDGNANFNTAGEFGVTNQGSAEIIIANTANDADRQVTIGSDLIHTGQIRPEVDGKHNVTISAVPAALTKLGTTDRQFKLINISAPISIDAALMNAKALTVNNRLTITAGALGIPATISNGANLTINSGATLNAGVKAIGDSVGNLEFIGNGSTATAMVLPEIGEVTDKLGTLNLTNTHVTVGSGNMYVQDLTMDNSKLNLSTLAVSVDNLDFTGNNTITTTVSDTSYGSLNIVDGITSTGGTLSFVLQSDSHISNNTVLAVLSGNLDGISIAGVTTSTQDNTNGGQIVFAEELPFSSIVLDPLNPGKLLVVTDTDKKQDLVNAVQDADPNSASIAQDIVDRIDDHKELANIALAIQQAHKNSTTVDVTSSLTDPSDTSASIDQGVMIDPNDNAKVSVAIISAVAPSGDGDSEAHLWTKILGGRATQKSDNSLPSYNQSMRGIMIGVDRDFSERLNIGLAVNLYESNFAYTGKKLGDSMGARGIGLYGFSTYYFNDKVFMNNIISRSVNTIDSKRVRVISQGQDALATAEHQSRTYSGIAKLGYKKQLSSAYTITPTLGLMHNYTKDDAYTETGAGNWNFTSDANSRYKTVFLAGVSLEGNYETWKPELHLNIYQTMLERKDKASFGFEWMQTGQRFSNEGPQSPTTQVNAGFNLGINPADGIYTEVIGELNISKNIVSYQGALSVKINF